MTNITTHPFLIIFYFLFITYGQEVITSTESVQWNYEIMERYCASPPNLSFSDVMLVA